MKILLAIFLVTFSAIVYSEENANYDIKIGTDINYSIKKMTDIGYKISGLEEAPGDKDEKLSYFSKNDIVIRFRVKSEKITGISLCVSDWKAKNVRFEKNINVLGINSKSDEIIISIK